MPPSKGSVQSPRQQRRLGWGLLLALIVAIIYLPIVGNEFVYDSKSQILNDPFIHNLGNLPDVLSLKVLGRDVLDFNRPANLASLMIDSLLWKKNPVGYHLTNLLLHVSNCVLLFLLLSGFLIQPGGPSPKGNPSQFGSSPILIAFVAALFFGLHPVNVEAAAEVAYREDLLVVFFSLTGLLFATRPAWKLAGSIAAVACFFLAAASKETGMLTPLWLGAVALTDKSKAHKNWPLLLVGATVAVGLFAAARFLMGAEGHSVIFGEKAGRLGGSFMETLLIQTRIWAFYFRQIVLPMDLCADYGAYTVRNVSFIGGLLALLGVVGLQLFLSLRSPLFAFGTVTFWFFLLPASNLLPIFRPMADRFLYFPMIGVALMLASLIQMLPQRRMALAMAVLFAAILPLAARTLAQERIWHDSESLWKATLQANPGSITALNNLADEYLEQNKPGQALDALAKGGLALRYQTAETFALRAVALDGVGQRAPADAAFKEAVHRDPKYSKPDLLVEGLTWSRPAADKLQAIANRN